jgi:hypothetical protein
MSQVNQKNSEYSEYRLPSPIANPENKPFLDAAQIGELLVKHCNTCQ